MDMVGYAKLVTCWLGSVSKIMNKIINFLLRLLRGIFSKRSYPLLGEEICRLKWRSAQLWTDWADLRSLTMKKTTLAAPTKR